jgi:DNA-binding Lrp family transcriptional regulator
MKKETELKLIVELMKDGRKSDRALAKAIDVSQPTITRLRGKLEREGIIKEYTMIPDFHKLGFEIVAITFSRFLKELTEEELKELRKTSKELEKKNPRAVLMAMNGMGLGFNRVFISFHESYSSYTKTISLIKTIPNVDPSHIESFIISLVDEEHYQPLTFSTIAKYLLGAQESMLSK